MGNSLVVYHPTDEELRQAAEENNRQFLDVYLAALTSARAALADEQPALMADLRHAQDTLNAAQTALSINKTQINNLDRLASNVKALKSQWGR